MIWCLANASSAAMKALSALGFPAFARKNQKDDADTSGPASNTVTQARRDALQLSALECQIARLKSMSRHDPRRGQLRRAIYSARHDMLRLK